MTASTTSPDTRNTFESTIGGYTVGGRVHSLSACAVPLASTHDGVGVRLFRVHENRRSRTVQRRRLPHERRRDQRQPLADMFAWMGSTPWFVEFANVAVPWGELLIGLGLLVGALVRLAAFFGALMMPCSTSGTGRSPTASSTVTSRTCSCSSLSPHSVPTGSSVLTHGSRTTTSAVRRSSSATPP